MLEVALAIPYWLELAATIAGAIFGALSAVRAKYDIFGVCCIAIVVGLAGGITRDILLQDYGIYAFQKPNLILACIVAGIVAFYFGKLMTYFDPFMDFLDNLSVALWPSSARARRSPPASTWCPPSSWAPLPQTAAASCATSA